MDGKRRADDHPKGNKKPRKAIEIKSKLDIVKRLDEGEKASNIARSLGLPQSTVRTIKVNADKFRESATTGVSMSDTIITKHRPPIMEKMEQLLFTWIQDLNQRKIPVNTSIIQMKAQSLFSMIKENENVNFNASRGWFDKFKKRYKLHNIKLSGEAASADLEAAKSFPEKLKSIIEEGGYSPKQVFNVDETGLYWKRLPTRTFISKEESTTPGYKIAKERLTLLLGGNAFGDFKLKPLLVYNSENPRALKNIQKGSLPVIWRCNKKAWMTESIFIDWFKNEFCPAVKEYCLKNNLSHRVLLILDNAPGHPNILDEVNENVKVVFLPPNTTSLLQPMDQGVIASFKAYYLRRTFKQIIDALDISIESNEERQISIKDIWRKYDIYKAIQNIRDSWKEVTTSNMNKVWRKVWPEYIESLHSVVVDDEQDDHEQILSDILDLAREVGFTELSDEDITELIHVQEEPLSNEELIRIFEGSKETNSDNDNSGKGNKNIFTTNELSEFFCHIEKALKILENDPDRERSERVSFAISNSITCYKDLYKTKRLEGSQPTLNRFFKPSTSHADAERNRRDPIPVPQILLSSDED